MGRSVNKLQDSIEAVAHLVWNACKKFEQNTTAKKLTLTRGSFVFIRFACLFYDRYCFVFANIALVIQIVPLIITRTVKQNQIN